MAIPLTEQKKVYKMAMEKRWNELVEYYENDGTSVLSPISVAEDTVLHIAVQSKQAYPLNSLIAIADYSFPFQPDEEGGVLYPLFVGNAYGNTAMHLAATVGNLAAIKLLAERFPALVTNTNEAGETPLFMAASFGENKIVDYLINDQIVNDKLAECHRTRSDGTSILHIAVQGEHFDTALLLLQKDKSLEELKDKMENNTFHLLANMRSSFKSGYSKGPLTKLFYHCLPMEQCSPTSIKTERENWSRLSGSMQVSESVETERSDTGSRLSDYLQLCYKLCLNLKQSIKWIYLWYCESLFEGWPIMKKVWDEKRKHELAVNLAQFLIKSDLSWLAFARGNRTSSGSMTTLSYDSKARQSGSSASGAEKHNKEGEGDDMYTPTPLFIATENGITEIVEEILIQWPQAVEHVDNNGRNILHVAIMHRRQEIFDFVMRNSMQIDRLKLGVDNDGYTLLHHAADTRHYTGGSKPGPALQLQEELEWFEKVEELVPSHYALHRSNEQNSGANNGDSKPGPAPQLQEDELQTERISVPSRNALQRSKEEKITAWELLNKKHKEQLKDAQEWVKSTSTSCSTVAVLVATVVFAAAYAVPGGYDSSTGVPVFLKVQKQSPYFLFFTIMDVISLAFSLTSVVMFLSILTSPFEMKDFLHSLPRKFMLGFTLLFISVVTTMLTFGASILLTVQSQQKLTSGLLSVAAFIPALVFALMQFRLYIAFIGLLIDFINSIRKVLPYYFLPTFYLLILCYFFGYIISCFIVL